MVPGSYTVNAAKKVASRFGTSFKLLIDNGDGAYITWSNRCVTDALARLVQDNSVS